MGLNDNRGWCNDPGDVAVKYIVEAAPGTTEGTSYWPVIMTHDTIVNHLNSFQSLRGRGLPGLHAAPRPGQAKIIARHQGGREDWDDPQTLRAVGKKVPR
jgi:hypothetical protein